jgi:hypothetical protein
LQNLRTLIVGDRMLHPKTYGTGEKVILSVEDDNAAYVLLELGFNEVGGDYSYTGFRMEVRRWLFFGVPGHM